MLALGLSAGAVIFFKYIPNYTPEHNSLRGMPGWIALAYLTIQLWMLLNAAVRVHLTSILDAALAIAPVVTGIVCFVLYTIGYFDLSLYQLNALAMLTVTGLVEFITTLWVRNVVLQRSSVTTVLPAST